MLTSTVLSTILSMLGGGFMRLLPELLGIWNKITDNKHELALMDKQIELQKQKGIDDRETALVHGNIAQQAVMTKGEIDQALALLDANKSALETQMQKTGIKIVDTLNFLVRPVTTYYFLALHGLAKVAMFVIALQANLNTWEAIKEIYGAQDVVILSGILSFWFVGRVFDKNKK